MFSFLKSKTFWLTVAHIGIVALGAYGAYSSGTPLPLVITGGVNALLASPATPAGPPADPPPPPADPPTTN